MLISYQRGPLPSVLPAAIKAQDGDTGINQMLTYSITAGRGHSSQVTEVLGFTLHIHLFIWLYQVCRPVYDVLMTMYTLEDTGWFAITALLPI